MKLCHTCCDGCGNDCVNTALPLPTLPGLNASPYRPACTGSDSPSFPQHKKNDLFEVYVNVTVVEDYHRTSDPGNHPINGAGIPPYTRPNVGAALPCSLSVTCGAKIADNTDPYCGDWVVNVAEIGGCAPGNRLLDQNCYADSGEAINLSVCHKRGFKNLLVKKSWHGQFGFMSGDGNCTTTLGTDCFNCNFKPENISPDQTKFLQREYHALVEKKVDWGGTGSFAINVHLSLDVTVSVGRYTGNVTRSCVFSYYVTDQFGVTTDYTYEDYLSQLSSSHPGDLVYILNTFLLAEYDCAGNVSTPDSSTTTYLNTGYTNTDSFGSQTYTKSVSNSDATIDFVATAVALGGDPAYTDTAHGESKLSAPYTSTDVWNDLIGLAAVVNLGDDNIYPWRVDGRRGQAPMVYYDEYGPTSPGFSYTCGAGPLPTITGGQDCQTCLGFPDLPPKSGAVVGAFNPAGSQPHFDFTHQPQDCCTDPDSGVLASYPTGNGSWNPAAGAAAAKERNGYFPPCATRWTNIAEEQVNRPCGWVGGFDTIFLQKWAEIKDQYPSHNFARPYGADRWLFDELHTGCITEYSTSGSDYIINVKFEAGTTGAPSISSGVTPCIITGIPVPGMYVVTDLGDYSSPYDGVVRQYQTGTLIAPLPSALTITGSAFGPARYPSAPAFGARDTDRAQTRALIATAVQNIDGVTIDITLATPIPWARTGDSVIFEDTLSALGTLAITFTDSTTIHVTATLPGGYSGTGGYILPVGVTEAWDDEQSKGEYLFAAFSFNFRDFAERNRVIAQWPLCNNCSDAAPGDTSLIRDYQLGLGLDQSLTDASVSAHCLPLKACNPSVIAVVPKQADGTFLESWANGQNFEISNIGADSIYGVLWEGEPIVRMADPIFRRPHADCEQFAAAAVAPEHGSYSGWTWRGDDGSCSVDTDPNFYYQTNNWVEPRLGTPGPTLPGDVFLEAQAFPVTSGNWSVNHVLYLPPGQIGFTPCDNLDVGGPWVDLAIMCGCISGGGRWAAEYFNYGQQCSGI